ncbi:hypothetical protein [Brunnivagina elsteri]|uniref:Uncharacterized protein n=1 Tax=Brunnivagina elsteri CCALA 953 TaxID=987040 RepID=A0A2A2TAU8_9CYAN|nr:hypothetical protein [Calothrix elsteri]PAX49076.1 hypothetical protein CK510_27975 [Calothrix elsteri CCALA 953]
MVYQGRLKSDTSLTLEERTSSLQDSYSIAEVIPNDRDSVIAVARTSESSTTHSLIVPSARFSPFFTPDDFKICNSVTESIIESNIAASGKFEAIEVETEEKTGSCVSLNLDILKCFESVKLQYEELGIIFSNCIAIEPSNPAFPTNEGSIVLMGAPKSGFLEAAFLNPINTAKVLITSSQRLIMSAYNRDRQLIVQNILPGANLANTDSVVPPNALLSVKAQDIYSISLCAFDGQFTIDEFSFCF